MKQLKKEFRELDSRQLVETCARIAADNKGEDLVILDVHKASSFTDYFLILSGRSTRHVQALAESLEQGLRAKRISSNRPEGLAEGTWVLLDFDDVIVHIFYRDQRDFYDLEGLWHDAPRLDLGL